MIANDFYFSYLNINRTYVDNRSEATITSKYQLAAKYGRENKNCAEQYDDCVISFLDITRKLGTFFF